VTSNRPEPFYILFLRTFLSYTNNKHTKLRVRMPSSKVTVTLGGPKDWELWYELIKTTAIKLRVWKHVNPDVDETERTKPVMPELTLQSTTTTPDSTQESSTLREATIAPNGEGFRTALEEFKYERKRYDDEVDGINEMAVQIQSSIEKDFIEYTMYCDSDPYQMLKKLKSRFAPTDRGRELDLLNDWRDVQKQGKLDWETWLFKWQVTYEKCKKQNLPDVQGTRPVYDLLSSVAKTSPGFSDSWRVRLADSDSYTFEQVLQNYREYRRNNLVPVQSRGSHGAFATQSESKGKDKKPTFKGRTAPGEGKPPGKCLCGEDHWFQECAYLIPSKRTRDWKENKDTRAKVEEQLKKSDFLRTKIQALQKQDREKNKPRPQSGDETSYKEPENFAIMLSVSKNGAYKENQDEEDIATIFNVTQNHTGNFQVSPLTESTILDSGADLHVFNDRTRFRDLVRAPRTHKVKAGNTRVQIEAYGTVDIPLICPGKPGGVRLITLSNCALIPGFHLNVASLRKFHANMVFWDTKEECMYFEPKKGERTLFCQVQDIHNQFVLDYRPVDAPQAFPVGQYEPRNIQKGSVDEWHKRMGHLNHEAVRNLNKSTSGVQVKEGQYDSNCEVCRTVNSRRIISRYPTVRATTPFYRIHLDLVAMEQGEDGESLFIHFLDDCTRMNFVYALPNKRQETILQTIRDFVQYAKVRWNRIVRIIRRDNESGLGKQYSNWVLDTGITEELSAPYTPEQNGSAERSGQALVVRFRALKAESNLPKKIWKEIVITAGYLLNRSPTRSLDWKTPIGQLQGQLPDLSHLRMYGCRAYPRISNIPKLDKLALRAEVGYLVGYESTNIFKIWIPCTSRIISTRDVTFDETKRYDQVYEDQLALAIQQSRTTTIQFPEIQPPENQIEELEDNDSEPHPQQTQEISLSYTNNQPEKDRTGSEGVVVGENIPAQQLLSPDITPEPENCIETQIPSNINPELEDYTEVQAPKKSQKNENKAVRRAEVVADLRPDNILQGSRKKVPSRKAAYITMLYTPEDRLAFYSSFLKAQVYEGKRTPRKRDLEKEPGNWVEMQHHSERMGFERAARIEYETLKARETWELVRSSTVNYPYTIPLKWVFTYKWNEDDTFNKHKARLVVRGDKQKGSLYEETYAATLAFKTYRALVAIAAYFDLEIKQYDAINAFTNSLIDEEIFVQCPPGFEEEGYCMRLKRALYGLKRSPLLWFKDLGATLEKLGLVRVPEAHCLFVSKYLTVFFYVDDIAILYHKKHQYEYNIFRSKLLETYEMREMGDMKWFLNIRLVRDRQARKIWLCQDAYMRSLAQKHHCTDGPNPKVPLSIEELLPYEGQATLEAIHEYQTIVGGITYPAVVTRPDIARTASKLAEFQTNPGPEHLAAAKKTIKYLYGSKGLALQYGPEIGEAIVQSSSDASFGDDRTNRKSTEGYLFILFGGPIDWKSTKQKTVTTSTTEAELLALSHAASVQYYWKRFFDQIRLELDEEIVMHCDNLQTVRLMLTDTPKLTTKLRHVDIHQHWLRQEVQNENFKVEWIRTAEMKADGLTKALPRQLHERFVHQLGMVDLTDKIESGVEEKSVQM
jgi:hypothetical protein